MHSEILIRQDRFEAGLMKLKEGSLVLAGSQKELVPTQEKLIKSKKKLIAIQERQEKKMVNILKVLADDVPKLDELSGM